jgi:hypothetical protein
MATAKGYDDSPPRNGIIFFYTVLAVFMLIGVKFLLDSYFASMMNAEMYEKIYSRGMEQVAAVREKEAQQLQKGNVPIEQAIRLIAQRGRGASPLITPEGSPVAPEISGWSQMKRNLPEAPKAVPAPVQPAEQPGAPEAAPAPAHPHTGAPAGAAH